MNGLLIMSSDSEVACCITPHPTEHGTVLLYVIFYDLELPPIPVPVAELKASMEVWFGNAKT